jgi:cell division septation protein DedD
MDDDFNPEAVRPAEYLPDTEFTLGPMVIAGLVAVLLLLCGLCFWLGYAMGSRNSRALQPAAQTAAPSTPQAAGAAAKPPAAPPSVHHSSSASQSDTTVSNPTGAAQSVSPETLPASQLIVRPALATAQTAPAPASVLMVQIASVSHQEDADVLVGALRKRGYAVAVRRDPADNMFHVRVGPFSSFNDANATRQKLLNDGYNAIVEP